MLILMLAAVLAISICGCTPKESENPAETPAPTDIRPTGSPEETPGQTQEPELTPTPVATPKPLEIPEVSVETRPQEPVLQPAVGENGKVLLNSVIPAQSRRTVEYWVDDPYKPYNAFGSIAGDYVMLDQGLPVTMKFFAEVKIRLTDYSFVTQLVSDETGANRPATWKLYGANLSNFEDEVLLDAREDVELPMENGKESELFAIESPDYYQFYRIVFERSAGNTQTVEFDDMNIYGEDGNCIGDYIYYNSSLEGYTILNGALNTRMCFIEPFPQRELPPTNLYDCDIDTYCTVNCQYSKESEYVDFTFSFKQEVQIDAFRFTTAEIGCPVTWELLGSNDKKFADENVVVVDAHTNAAMPGYDYAESDVFVVQNPGAFKYYMLRVYRDVFGGNDENWLNPSWRELTLLAKNENVGK